MKGLVASLAIVALIVALVIVASLPDSAPYSDRPHGERHEKVSLAAIAALPTFTAPVAVDVRAIQQAIAAEYAALHGRHVGGLAAQAAAIVPDPTLTPGAVRTVNIGEVCSTSTRELRHWDRARARPTAMEHGLPLWPSPAIREVDHLIPVTPRRREMKMAKPWPEPSSSIELRAWSRRAEGRARGSDVRAGVLRRARCGGSPAGDRGRLDGRVREVHRRATMIKVLRRTLPRQIEATPRQNLS